jgi:hypothetical protein
MAGMKIRFASLVVWFSVLVAANAPAAVLYVDVNSTNPMPPYSDWATAATNIQDAVDAANPGDTVLVNDGDYQTGSRLSSDGATNRVVVTNALTLQSINGSAATVIDGGNVMRCVYLVDGASLAGFTITNGNAGWKNDGGGVCCTSTNVLVSNCLVISNSSGYGGGVISGTVNNCILSDNYSSGQGGGAVGCILNNCVISNNSAMEEGGGVVAGTTISILNNCVVFGNTSYDDERGGGGVAFAILNNCLIVSNTATAGYGGGTYSCALNNCTIVGNQAFRVGGVFYGNTFNFLNVYANNCISFYNSPHIDSGPFTNCCAANPYNGSVITNAPLFMNMAGGDFHLQSNSPCINSGNNSFVGSASDLDGNPRIVGGTVDIGCYEYQTPTSIISYAWLQQYGFLFSRRRNLDDPNRSSFERCRRWLGW